MTASRVGMFTLLGLALTAAGILVPIAWDRYKTKAALELQILGTSQLASAVAEADGLTFSYKGRRVPNLAKLDLAIVNTGRTPLPEKDVAEPILVTLDGAEILDVRIVRTTPANVRASTRVATDRHSLTFLFRLLNPGDVVQLAVLTSGRPNVRSAEARITGVREVDVVRRGYDTLPAWRRVPTSLYLVAAGTLLAGVFAAAGFFLLGLETGYENVWKRGCLVVPDQGTRETYKDFLSGVFGKDKMPELKTAKGYLDALPSGVALTPDQRTSFLTLLNAALTDFKAARSATITFTVLFLVGVAYIIASFP